MTERGAAGEADPSAKAGSVRWFRWWRVVVAVGLLIILLVAARLENLVEILRQVSPSWALAVVGLLAVWLLLGGLKVWFLLRCLHPAPLGAFLSAYLVSWATALLLPGQLGDATQVILLRRYGVPMARSSASYLLDKSVSLGWMALVATYGLGLYTPLGLEDLWLLALPALALLIVVVAVVVLRRVSWRPGGLAGRVRLALDRLLENLMTFRGHLGAVTLNVVLTWFKWGLLALIYKGAFHAFGYSISLEAAATIPIMSSFIGYIPITVGGAGTSELTAVVLFGRIGIGSPIVLSAYLFLRAVLLGGALVTICLSRTGER
jgi:uncharacterized protein (TIRG00374 family)